MPEVPCPNTFRVTARGTNPAGEIWNNVMHFRFLTDPLQSDIDALLTRVAAFYTAVEAAPSPGITQYRGTGNVLTQVLYNDLRTVPNPQGQVLQISSGAGQNTEAMMPLDCAVVVTLLTNLVGRSYKGRIFLTGFTEQQNLYTTAAVPPRFSASLEVATRFADMTNDLAGIGWAIGVLSLVNNKVERPSGVITPCTAVKVDQRWDTQRRRDLDWQPESTQLPANVP